jgi:hypothetical protein
VSLELHIILQNSFLIDYYRGRIIIFLFAESPLESEKLGGGTREISQNKQDNSESEVCLQGNESISMEDNDDEFHSLESSDHAIDSASHSIVDSADVQSECLLKKLQVGNAESRKEEIVSAQVQPVEGREQLKPSQPTTRNAETNPQNSASDLETVAMDTVEVIRLVGERASNLEAAEAIAQKTAEPVVPEADVEEKEPSLTAEGKSKSKAIPVTGRGGL